MCPLWTRARNETAETYINIRAKITQKVNKDNKTDLRSWMKYVTISSTCVAERTREVMAAWLLGVVCVIWAVILLIYAYREYVLWWVKHKSVLYCEFGKCVRRVSEQLYRGVELEQNYSVELSFQDKSGYEGFEASAVWPGYVQSHFEFMSHACERAMHNRGLIVGLRNQLAAMEPLRVSVKGPYTDSAYRNRMERKLCDELLWHMTKDVVDDMCVRFIKTADFAGAVQQEECARYGLPQVAEALKAAGW